MSGPIPPSPSSIGPGETMGRADFFVSYTQADRAWAEWVAWQLEQAGYQVIVQAWDFEPGDNFVVRMRDALEQADRTLALVSAAYLASPYCTDEWTSAFLHDAHGRNRLLQVRIEECELPRLLHAQVHIDLAGLPGQQARSRLLTEVKRGRRKPSSEPPFPGREAENMGPRFPGYGPEVINLPPRNPCFTGREALLGSLHVAFGRPSPGMSVSLQALHGLGGVGKTEAALEYAYRYATDYDLVWWIPAEKPLAIPESFARLATRLEMSQPADQDEVVAAVLDDLRRRDRWLLVFDNAESPAGLGSYRPSQGSGQVLVTSRNPAWGGVGKSVKVDVLSREEAISFLLLRTGSTDSVSAEVLAGELGDLPLALEQAAAYIEQSGMTLAEYVALFRRHREALLSKGEPVAYAGTVDTTWRLAMERIAGQQPAAVELLNLSAFLAPDAIPLDLIAEHSDVLPPRLALHLHDDFAFHDAVAMLHRYSLVDRDETGIRVHRLVQAVIRKELSVSERAAWAGAAVRLVAAAFPYNQWTGVDAKKWEVDTWPLRSRLISHALSAAEHASALGAEGEVTGTLLHQVAGYLWSRGNIEEARALFERALTIQEVSLGSDHLSVAETLDALGVVLHDLDDIPRARAVHERALAAREAHLGPDHPAVAWTLWLLSHVLLHLGDVPTAQAAIERSLAIAEAQLEPDDPQVTMSLTGLSDIQVRLGDLEAARATRERVLSIRQAKYADDDLLVAASWGSLALVLHDLGDLEAARAAHQQALRIREARLGQEHLDIAISLTNLGLVLGDLGDIPAAKAAHQRALSMVERKLDPKHATVVRIRTNLDALER